MAKTDFSKAEDSFSESLKKFSLEKLLDLADAAQGNPTSPSSHHISQARTRIIILLRLELNRLYKINRELFHKLGKSKKELNAFLEKTNHSDTAYWEEIKSLKEKVDALLKEAAQIAPIHTNDDIINQERHKHINKRYNVNDKWLPLH